MRPDRAALTLHARANAAGSAGATLSRVAKTCPHCATVVDDDAAVCSGCGADLAPVEPTSSLPRIDARALVLWALLVVPGLALTLVGLVIAESTVLVVAGLVLLAVPIVLQLFAADWGDAG